MAITGIEQADILEIDRQVRLRRNKWRMLFY